jgi:segregation and condensation protein A
VSTLLSEYKVTLDVYDGPLDLLLFLIRREEVDIYDIPIAGIMEQYLAHVEVLKSLDPDTASEFLVMAATLMEIKSRMLLPRPPAMEEEEDLSDPRLELVRQLLEYKKYKDAALHLEEEAQSRAAKHPRVPVIPNLDNNEVDLESVEVWDLFDAFKRVLEQIGQAEPTHQVGIDDTPISLHADDILDSLQRHDGRQPFTDIFAGRPLGEMIGLFLALLELIRAKRVRAIQDSPFDQILVHLIDPTPLTHLGEDATLDGTAAEATFTPTSPKDGASEDDEPSPETVPLDDTDSDLGAENDMDVEDEEHAEDAIEVEADTDAEAEASFEADTDAEDDINTEEAGTDPSGPEELR